MQTMQVFVCVWTRRHADEMRVVRLCMYACVSIYRQDMGLQERIHEGLARAEGGSMGGDTAVVYVPTKVQELLDTVFGGEGADAHATSDSDSRAVLMAAVAATVPRTTPSTKDAQNDTYSSEDEKQVRVPMVRTPPRSQRSGNARTMDIKKQHEYYSLLPVSLSGPDAQRVFDIGARLRYSTGLESVRAALRDLRCCLRDFPVAALLEKGGSVLRATVDIAAGTLHSETSSELRCDATDCIETLVNTLVVELDTQVDGTLTACHRPTVRGDDLDCVSETVTASRGTFADYDQVLDYSYPGTNHTATSHDSVFAMSPSSVLSPPGPTDALGVVHTILVGLLRAACGGRGHGHGRGRAWKGESILGRGPGGGAVYTPRAAEVAGAITAALSFLRGALRHASASRAVETNLDAYVGILSRGFRAMTRTSGNGIRLESGDDITLIALALDVMWFVRIDAGMRTCADAEVIDALREVLDNDFVRVADPALADKIRAVLATCSFVRAEREDCLRAAVDALESFQQIDDIVASTSGSASDDDNENGQPSHGNGMHAMKSLHAADIVALVGSALPALDFATTDKARACVDVLQRALAASYLPADYNEEDATAGTSARNVVAPATDALCRLVQHRRRDIRYATLVAMSQGIAQKTKTRTKRATARASSKDKSVSHSWTQVLLSNKVFCAIVRDCLHDAEAGATADAASDFLVTALNAFDAAYDEQLCGAIEACAPWLECAASPDAVSAGVYTASSAALRMLHQHRLTRGSEGERNEKSMLTFVRQLFLHRDEVSQAVAIQCLHDYSGNGGKSDKLVFLLGHLGDRRNDGTDIIGCGPGSTLSLSSSSSSSLPSLSHGEVVGDVSCDDVDNLVAILGTVNERSIRTSAIFQLEALMKAAFACPGADAASSDLDSLLLTLIRFVLDNENDDDAVAAALRILALAANKSIAAHAWLVGSSLPWFEFSPLTCLLPQLFSSHTGIQFATVCLYAVVAFPFIAKGNVNDGTYVRTGSLHSILVSAYSFPFHIETASEECEAAHSASATSALPALIAMEDVDRFRLLSSVSVSNAVHALEKKGEGDKAGGDTVRSDARIGASIIRNVNSSLAIGTLLEDAFRGYESIRRSRRHLGEGSAGGGSGDGQNLANEPEDDNCEVDARTVGFMALLHLRVRSSLSADFASQLASSAWLDQVAKVFAGPGVTPFTSLKTVQDVHMRTNILAVIQNVFSKCDTVAQDVAVVAALLVKDLMHAFCSSTRVETSQAMTDDERALKAAHDAHALQILELTESLLLATASSSSAVGRSENASKAITEVLYVDTTVDALATLQDPHREKWSYLCRLTSARCLNLLLQLASTHKLPYMSNGVVVDTVTRSLYASRKDDSIAAKLTGSLKDRQIDFSGKALAKEHIQILVTIVSRCTPQSWASAWLQNSTTFWLYALSRDRDCTLRAAALRLIACLLVTPSGGTDHETGEETHNDGGGANDGDRCRPNAVSVREKLVSTWPEVKDVLVCAALERRESDEVRSVALHGIRKVVAHELREKSEGGAQDVGGSVSQSTPKSFGVMSQLVTFQTHVARQSDGASVADFSLALIERRCPAADASVVRVASPLVDAAASIYLDLLRYGITDLSDSETDEALTVLASSMRSCSSSLTDLQDSSSPHFTRRRATEKLASEEVHATTSASSSGSVSSSGTHMHAALRRSDKRRVDAYRSIGSLAAAIEYVISGCDEKSKTGGVNEHTLRQVNSALAAVLAVTEPPRAQEGSGRDTPSSAASKAFADMIESVMVCLNSALIIDTSATFATLETSPAMATPYASLLKSLERIMTGIQTLSATTWAASIACCRVLATLLSLDGVSAVVDVSTKAGGDRERWNGPKVFRKLASVLLRRFAEAHRSVRAAAAATSSPSCSGLPSTSESTVLLHRATIAAALKNVLASSASAKNAFVAGRHVHSSLRTIRDGANLAVSEDLIDHARSASTRERSQHQRRMWVQEATEAMAILRSVLTNASSAVRTEANEAGVLTVMREVWSLACGEHSLMHELLGVVANIMHLEPSIKAAVVGDEKESATTSFSASKNGASLALLMNNLISRVGLAPQTFAIALTCLQQLCTSTHSLASITKMSFLGGGVCTKVFLESAKKRDFVKQEAILRLFATLGATRGGQKLLIQDKSLRPALDEVLRLTEVKRLGLQRAALAVWHNLAFSLEAKAYFGGANPASLECFLRILETHDGDDYRDGAGSTRALVTTILWALAFNSEKIKLLLKKKGVLRLLLSSHDVLEKHPLATTGDMLPDMLPHDTNDASTRDGALPHSPKTNAHEQRAASFLAQLLDVDAVCS